MQVLRGIFLAVMGCLSTSMACAAVDGVQFTCSAAQISALQDGMPRYLHELGIQDDLVTVEVNLAHGSVTYVLRTAAEDSNTLDLHLRPNMAVHEEVVQLPGPGGVSRKVVTVSKKEILLALLQHGRLSVFSGRACNVQALKDHVELRQNIVAWAERLAWQWPNGGSAMWHTKYWNEGTPVNRWPLREVLLDAFLNQKKYAIGCYTATKLVLVQGVTDYYLRIKRDGALITQRLMSDADPLVHVEPAGMWSFEGDFDHHELDQAGKLLKLIRGVASQNFVPGDWAYLANTDPGTQNKTGYEGSNALYLGRNRFDDYYNDNAHSYTYEQKLDEVFQWRHGVFSRSRDAAKLRPLAKMDLIRLGQTPSNGGLVHDFRVIPYLFGYEDLPSLPGR